MSRTTLNIPYTSFEKTRDFVVNILMSSGYKETNNNSETVWKSGAGFLTAPKFIKVEYGADNTLSLSGWIQPTMGKEQDLNGVVGAIPKKQVLKLMQRIQAGVQQL